MNQLRVEIAPSNELPDTLRDEIRHWLISEFIDEGDETVWSEVDWHILGWLDDRLVSHVDIVDRLARVGDSPVSLGGIGGVVTQPTWRGKGIGSKLMNVSHRFMDDEMGVDFGLLMCDESRVTYYESLGWQRAENQLVYDQPSGSVIFDDVVMFYLIRQNEFPHGEIDIRGYPW